MAGEHPTSGALEQTDDVVVKSTASSPVLTQLSTEMQAFRRRMTVAYAWCMIAVAIAAITYEWSAVSPLDRAVMFFGLGVALATLWTAWSGRTTAAMVMLSTASLLFLGWTTLYLPNSEMTPLYLLFPAMMATIVLQDWRWSLVGNGVLLAAAVIMRVLYYVWYDADPSQTTALLFDTTAIFIFGMVLTALHRHRSDKDRRLLEDALHANQILARRAVEARDAAREANDLKSDFLSRISHELRTPLNAILGYAELIEEEELIDPDGQPDLAKIHASGRHLLGLVDDLLDLTKLESGEMNIMVQPVDPGPLLHEAAEAVRPLAQRNRIEVKVSVDGTGPVDLDPHRVRQILGHLLSNAARFTEDGIIELTGRVEPDAMVLAVGDTGVGIDAQRLPRLFEPFVQGTSQTQYDKGGAGLGLALCDRLVRQMGGHIDVASKVGEGSTFTVTLPTRVLA